MEINVQPAITPWGTTQMQRQTNAVLNAEMEFLFLLMKLVMMEMLTIMMAALQPVLSSQVSVAQDSHLSVFSLPI